VDLYSTNSVGIEALSKDTVPLHFCYLQHIQRNSNNSVAQGWILILEGFGFETGGSSEFTHEHFAAYHIRSTAVFCKLSCNEAFLVLVRRSS
jgi:hypothetical protein